MSDKLTTGRIDYETLEKPTEEEKVTIRESIDTKITESRDTDPRLEIERIAAEIRAQYPGKQLCISAEFGRDGTYVVFVDGVATAKGRIKPVKNER